MVANIQELNPFMFLSFALCLFFLYKWLHYKFTAKRNLPPSPPKVPILGNLHHLGKHPHRSLRSISKKYGELMLFHLGSTPSLVVSSSRIASEIMKTHDVKFASRFINKTGKRLLYNCKDLASAPYGEHWRQMKSICVLQLLNNTKVRSFRAVREEETSLLMETISQSTSFPVNLSNLLKDFTTDVLCRAAFGRKYCEEQGTDFKNLMERFAELLGGFQVGDFISWLAWIQKIDGWERKVETTAMEFDRFLELVIQEHEDRQEGKTMIETGTYSDGKVKDFVDVLLEVQKNEAFGFSMDREGIKGLILDLFAGGTDTSSVCIEWAMTELLRNPDVMKELQREVREITGEKLNVEEDDLEQMKYLKAVIKESLRLYPPVPILVPRVSTQEAKIEGYEIKARTLILINAWAIQRDPTFWDEPEKFNPDRFLKKVVDVRGQDFELIPFGSGRRMCPGISFALAMNELVLANLVHRFDWTLPVGVTSRTLDMCECVGLTMHRKTPLLAIANVHKSKKRKLI